MRPIFALWLAFILLGMEPVQASDFLTPWAETLLPIEQVFDQGNTQWCWAYSAFHTLRTYNLIALDAGSTNGVWQWWSVLQPLNSPDAFRHYLSDHFSTGRTGNPQDLIDLMKQENNLPDQGWVSYSPDGRQSWRVRRSFSVDRRLSAREILQKVHQNLQKGIPSMYCTPPHCMMIYGDDSDKEAVQRYNIADSDGGETRQSSASQVEDDLDLVETMP